MKRKVCLLFYFLLLCYIQIEYRWEELRRAFLALDPHKTGCVSDHEFKSTVHEICMHVSETDMYKIMNRHAATDQRYSYHS